MDHSRIIGVDVDLTVVESVDPWKEWYFKLTGHDIGEITNVDNDLQSLMHRHHNPLEFWEKSDLYDEMQPFTEAVNILQMLHDEGFTIIFVSSCAPEHERSKRMFCQRHFPFMAGFVSTPDKQFVKMDYFIDDYDKNCKLVQDLQPDCGVFQIQSKINEKSDFMFGDWVMFYKFIQDLEWAKSGTPRLS